MSIRLRVYPQYNSWGYGLSMGPTYGVERAMRRRMRAQQRQIVRDQQLFSLHLMRQQLEMQRQLAQWNVSSAMHARAWDVPMLTGWSHLSTPYASPYGVTQAALGGYRYW